MPLPPTFILSLDCEGKWGMADNLQPYHHRLLTSANLADAYRRLLVMFARHDISATFAFVMAFTLDAAERQKFDILSRRNPDDQWLGHYWRCLDAGLGDGWHVPEAFDLVRSASMHEIAAHGFCHRSLGDDAIDHVGAIKELGFASKAAKLKGVELKTLVFPRNQVGNLPALRSEHYLGYRDRLACPGGRTGRIRALLDEFDRNSAPQKVAEPLGALVAIPPGRFFNWRFGARRLVPPSVTVARWRNQLRSCAESGGVVHLWTHPHNFITGPGTEPVLDAVLAEVARLRDRGRIEVMTQRALCERMAGKGSAAATAA